ncbi:MAG TPA: CaiB/BaiF CoA-transferase family protein [Vicinamibacteria bacterium]|nr:CaiB/BaiF CoA-transferase family protein [Vicinamibacteria bacterium]
MASRPLDGVRVLELGQLMAGPFAGTILGYFGAEVIKVEPPRTGDPVRTWRGMEDGVSLWWRSLGRNKRCVSLDLRRDEGRLLARRLAEKCDVVLENFRPGTLEKWGLGPATIRQTNPGVIYARVSGYGQTGPYAQRPGYASVCEGVGGFRYVTGFPDRPPVRPNLSLGDSLAGVHAALGVVMALYHRDRRGGDASAPLGQDVDVAIYEAVFNMMEAVVPEYDRLGLVRERQGSKLDGIVPSNTYRCADGQFVIVGGNGDSIYKRLMRAAGRPDMADDPRYATNPGRVRHEAEVDGAIALWTATLPAAEVMRRLEAADVPVGALFSAEDISRDPQYAARGMLEEVLVGGRPLRLPAIAPKLTKTPGRTEWPGPAVGAHNREILHGLLGLADEEIDRLEKDGVI